MDEGRAGRLARPFSFEPDQDARLASVIGSPK